jgi:hypothetical protein
LVTPVPALVFRTQCRDCPPPRHEGARELRRELTTPDHQDRFILFSYCYRSTNSVEMLIVDPAAAEVAGLSDVGYRPA